MTSFHPAGAVKIPVMDDRMEDLRIFVSYRRADTRGYAGWLSYCLEERYGRDNVFRDVDSLEPGVPFMDAIEKWIKKADVVLCVMGEKWSTITDAAGNRRLDAADDPVRAEVATALKRKGKRTIPVLIEGSRMPTPSELPEDIRALTDLNGHVLSDARWRDDFAKLDAFLSKLVQEKVEKGRRASVTGEEIVRRYKSQEEPPDFVGVAGGFPPKGKGSRLEELKATESLRSQEFQVQYGGVCPEHLNWGTIDAFVRAVESP
jgi:TIR domain